MTTGPDDAPARPATMQCQECQEDEATIHLAEISADEGDEGPIGSSVEQVHLCEECARRRGLPVKQAPSKVWKLLVSAQQQAESGRACPDCGMTLAEFRARGRLGCPRDYEVFAEHLEPLLERIHSAVVHVGRLPGMDDREVERIREVSELRDQLDAAIRAEEYERAAELRDRLQQLGVHDEA